MGIYLKNAGIGAYVAGKRTVMALSTAGRGVIYNCNNTAQASHRLTYFSQAHKAGGTSR